MKKSLFAAISCIALLGLFPACDQHTWENSEDGKTPGTKTLFEPHPHPPGDDHKGDHKHPAGEKGHEKEETPAK